MLEVFALFFRYFHSNQGAINCFFFRKILFFIIIKRETNLSLFFQRVPGAGRRASSCQPDLHTLQQECSQDDLKGALEAIVHTVPTYLSYTYLLTCILVG